MIHLLCAWALISDWKFTGPEFWENGKGDQVAYWVQPAKVSKRDMVARLGRNGAVNADAMVFLGTDTGACVRKRRESTVVCGFVDRTWILGEFKSKDCRAAAASFPNRTVAAIGRIPNRPTQYRLDHSDLVLLGGKVIALPPAWVWLDEKLGETLELPPDHLCHAGLSRSLEISQCKISQLSRIEKGLSYKGFSSKLLREGFEFNPKRRVTGYCLRLKDEWLVVSVVGMNAGELKVVSDFCKWLRVRATEPG